MGINKISQQKDTLFNAGNYFKFIGMLFLLLIFNYALTSTTAELIFTTKQNHTGNES
ncbi:MAG TPA: hypothetical protein VF677_00890 [Flavobacterium sp.]|jgi:hypothetical protein